MSKAESILFEIDQTPEDTVDKLDIQYVRIKSEGPAYASEQEAEGADRAQLVLALMIDEIKNQLPTSEVVKQAVLRFGTNTAFPLRLGEQVSIMQGLNDAIGKNVSAFTFFEDRNGSTGNRLKLSFVYWTKNQA